MVRSERALQVRDVPEHGGTVIGIIGKFGEFRQSQHAAEQIDALPIERTAGQRFIFADDPCGEVRRYPVRVDEFLVQRAEAPSRRNHRCR